MGGEPLLNEELIIEISEYLCNNFSDRYRYISLMKRFSKEYNIQFMTINSIKEINSDNFVTDFYYANILDIIDTAIKYNIITDELYMFYEFILGHKSNFRCRTAYDVFSVFPDGDITPCQLFGLDKSVSYVLGNINKIENLDSRLFKDIQSNVVNNTCKQKNKKCAKCVAKDICVDCIGININKCTDISPLQIYCDFNISRYNSFVAALITLYSDPYRLKEFILLVKRILLTFDSQRRSV